MNKLTVIMHPELGEVRSRMVKGEPWFVAKDVCDVLSIRNDRDAFARLDDDEKGVAITDTLGGRQEMNTVNESGLYSLIFQSRKAEAKKFRKWVTSEVLPAIRKNGFYVNPGTKLTKAQQRTLQTKLYEALSRYITDQDIVRIARRCARPPHGVRSVMRGVEYNTGVMTMLQETALMNREKQHSPYAVSNIQDIINKLK